MVGHWQPQRPRHRSAGQDLRGHAPLDPPGGHPQRPQQIPQGYLPAPHLTPPVAGPGWGAGRVLTVIGVCLLGGVLLLMLLLALLVLGPAGMVLVPLAAVPVLVIGTAIWLLDRWRPQSLLVMTLCLLWGAVVSVVMTLVLGLGAEIAYQLTQDQAPGMVSSVVFAPLIEETTKAALLLVITLAARRHLDGPFQGLLLGSLIGLGFGFTEDLLYMATATLESGAAAGGAMFVLRGVLTPFAHVAFTGVIGLFLGMGARRSGATGPLLMFAAGLPAGMVLHGLWNLVSEVTGEQTLRTVVAAGLMGMICFAGWMGAMLVLRDQEVRSTRGALRDYVPSGWLTPSEAELFGSWAGRRRALAWASRFPEAKRTMRRMIRISAVLAAVRLRLLRNPHSSWAEWTEERRLLEELTVMRARMLQRAGLG